MAADGGEMMGAGGANSSARVGIRESVIRLVSIALVVLMGVLSFASPVGAAPRDDQWYLDAIEVPEAQEVSRGDGVTIGLVNSGIYTGHPDLEGRLATPMAVEYNGNVIADTSGGVSTDLAVLAVGNGTGLLGVAPEATLQPVDDGVGRENLSVAVRWLVDQGIKIIVVASSSPFTDPLERDVIRYALAEGCVVIMAFSDTLEMPFLDTTGVLVVGALDRENGRYDWDGFSSVDLVALVDTSDMVCAGERGKEYRSSCTSKDRAAAALIGGVVALVWSRYPELSAASVVNRLLSTATDPGELDPEGEAEVEVEADDLRGVVNAAEAVTAEVPEVSVNPLGDPGPPSDDFDEDYDYDTMTHAEKARLVSIGLTGLMVGGTLAVVVVVVRYRRRLRSERNSNQ